MTSITLPQGASEIQFTSQLTGWILAGSTLSGSSRRVYRTTDGGSNWDIVLSSTSDTTFLAMNFVDNAVGWISTFESTIYRTYDGGITWEIFQTPFFLNSLSFIDTSSGWGGASNGEIYHTTNGGESWVPQFNPLGSPVEELKFTAPSFGWAVGLQGAILHTTNGGTTFVEQAPPESPLPQKVTLHQNYPNPFNPLTTITFEIPVGTRHAVSLRVFDVLGREVATLVEGQREPGMHQIQFDGTGLSSGVYFYRLRAGDYFQTKKLLLLR